MYRRTATSRSPETILFRRRRWAGPIAALTAIVLLAVCTTSGYGASPSPSPAPNSAPNSAPNLVGEGAPPGPVGGVLPARVGQTVSMATLRLANPDTVAASPAASGWQVVTKPPTSRAVVANGGFEPDVPGEYVLVRGDGAGSNRLQVDAGPAQPLVCVNTRAWTASGGETTAHVRVGATDYPRSGPGLQVVTLDRNTTAPFTATPWTGWSDSQTNQTFAEDPEGLQQYAAYLKSVKSTALVFINGTVNDADRSSVWGPLASLGAADLPTPFPADNVAFSFIGIPGLAAGEGWQAVDGQNTVTVPSPCAPSLVGDPTNDLSGWLTLDSTGKAYTYVSGQYAPVDTDAAPDTTTEHAIKVGDQTYTIPIANDESGWQALVVDRDSLCPATPPDWPAAANGCSQPAALLNKGYGQSGLATLYDDLAPFTRDPDALLILAPFGDGKGLRPGVNPPQALVGRLRDFGASPLAPGRAFETPQSRYALIGGGDHPGGLDTPVYPAQDLQYNPGPIPDNAGPVTESFTGFGGTGHLTGYLSRDNLNRFGPTQTSPTSQAVQDLSLIAFAPPASTTVWSQETGTKEYVFLSAHLGYSLEQYPGGIRSHYGDPTLNLNKEESFLDADLMWNGLSDEQKQQAGGDEANYNRVRSEIHNELEEAINANQWLGLMEAIILSSAAQQVPNTLVDTVKNEIADSYPNPPPGKTSLGIPLLQMFLGSAAKIPEGGEVFHVLGDVLDIALEVSRDPDGLTPEDIRSRVFDSADQMRDTALNFLNQAHNTLDSLYAIIVADPNKLAVVGENVAPVNPIGGGTDPNPHPWAIGANLNSVQNDLSEYLAAWLLPSMVDAGFKIYDVKIPSSDGYNGGDRTPPTLQCLDAHGIGGGTDHPFGTGHGFPANSWLKLDNGTATFYLQLAGIINDAGDAIEHGDWPPAPTQKLLDTLFGTVPGDFGLDQAWFYEQGFAKTQYVQYNNANNDRLAYVVDCQKNGDKP